MRWEAGGAGDRAAGCNRRPTYLRTSAAAELLRVKIGARVDAASLLDKTLRNAFRLDRRTVALMTIADFFSRLRDTPSQERISPAVLRRLHSSLARDPIANSMDSA
jgi:hypothetical protein